MVDYNKFAKTFAESRKNMKWPEIEYFLDKYNLEGKNVLDVWCWSGRLLSFIKDNVKDFSYTWADLSWELLKEAQKDHQESKFIELNMLDLDKIEWKFDIVFFIASFHHLDNEEDRLEVLLKAKNLLSDNWKVIMTNWALNSPVNKEKYSKSKIEESENKWWWEDYSIKIWDATRYYHAFSLYELEVLFKKTNYQIEENRLFDNERNYISVIS